MSYAFDRLDNQGIIFNGDCLEVMPDLIKQGIKVDAIITDVPYGTTACKWDTIIPFDLMWNNLNKLIKDNGAIVLFGSEPFSTQLRASNLKNFKYDWIWDKSSASNILCAKYQPLKTYEIISIFGANNKRVNYYPILSYGHKDRTAEKETFRKAGSVNGKTKRGLFFKTDKNKPADARYPKAIINISKQATECCNSKAVHPTQKPIELMEYLIKTYTNEDDLVLDFTMGSGSTCVACQNLNRKFIGIEKDEHYYNVRKKRLFDELH